MRVPRVAGGLPPGCRRAAAGLPAGCRCIEFGHSAADVHQNTDSGELWGPEWNPKRPVSPRMDAEKSRGRPREAKMES